MGQDKKQLKILLNFITNKLAYEQGNEWFVEELVERLENKQPTISYGNYFKKIRLKTSIDYNFVENQKLQKELVFYNLMMEKAYSDRNEKEEFECFYNFCINAFSQIEHIINFYYYKNFSTIDVLLTHLERIPETTFKRSGKEKNVMDIPMGVKIFHFGRIYYKRENNSDFTIANIQVLRDIKEKGFEKCIKLKSDPKEKLHNFFKYQNFSTVRGTLKKIMEVMSGLIRYY